MNTTMTIRSLIEHLVQFDDSLEVCIRSKGHYVPLTEEQISIEGVKHVDSHEDHIAVRAKSKSIAVVLG